MRSFLPALLAIACFTTAAAQELDDAFHSPVPFRAAYITKLVQQPDGNILVGGDLAYHGATPVGNVTRINPDGTLDESFSFSYSDEYFVRDLEIKPNGEIVVLLQKFSGYKNNAIFYGSKVAVLDSDGSIKQIVDSGQNTQAIVVQGDGKILVAGGPEDKALVRYNEDLTEDEDFTDAVTVNKYIADVKVHGDKIFLCGDFSEVNGVTKNDIVKLNLDGSIDDTFDTGEGTTDHVGTLTILDDGKVLPANCYINTFEGHTRNGSVRLDADGSVDETFEAFQMSGIMGDIFVINDKLYTTAYLNHETYSDLFVFRLNQDGTRDAAFEPVMLDFGSLPAQIVPVGDELMFTGPTTHGNVYGLVKVNDVGEFNETFAPKISRLGIIKFGDQQNDKLLVAGDFLRVDSLNTFGIARLNADGTVDDTFAVDINSGPVVQMKLLEDETALISTSGKFFKVDNVGDRVPEFNWTSPSFNLLYQVYKFKVLPDGKIMAGDANTLARLNADGSVDETFNIGHSSNSTLFGFDMQGDSIIYGRSHENETFDDLVTEVSRITPAGTYDPTFDAGIAPVFLGNEASIGMVKVLTNKEILVGGFFTEFDGEAIVHGLVKLSKDGKIDKTFNENQHASTGPSWLFDPQVEQIGSKIYIRGDYSIYVINIDGTVDSFNVPVSINGLSDIVAMSTITSEGEGENGRRKAIADNFIIALGSFQSAGSDAPMSLLRISVGQSETNEEPEEPGEPEEPQEPEVVTGLNESQNGQPKLQVFPQPTSRYLNVRFNSDNSDFKVTVYSLSGSRLIEQDFAAGNEVNTLDVSDMAAGMYAVKVTAKNGKTGHAKFVRTP